MREHPALFGFNRGIVSPLGLARTDQKRIALAAETMTNWIPRVLGPMSMRPGLGYIGATASNAAARVIPFVFATDDTALVEFTASTMRVWIDDTLLARSSVSTAITNDTFDLNVTGWTDNSDAGATTAWDTGGYLRLTGTGTAKASIYQAVTVAAGDQATEHGIHVVIVRGPVKFKVGTTLGGDDLFTEASLDTGTHSIAVTPGAATIYVQFSSTAAYKVQVSECSIEDAGTVTIASPYAAADLSYIRYDQSADFIFLACAGYQQRKIERRGTRPGARSWSLSLYHVDDGPFETQNTSPTTLTASALVGDITVTASAALFRSTHVGAIFEMVNQVAGVDASIAAQDTWTTGLKVTGSGDTRSITITLTGTWAAVVSLQVSSDNVTFADVPGYIWNGNATGPYLDGLDGQTRYYRIGVATGDYTSGTVGAALTFTSGTKSGVIEVTAYTSATAVSARVLSDVGSTSATTTWSEGSWSDYRGWPTATRFHEGRLWWAGQNGVFGSVSDNYYSMSEDIAGDSGPINRTIGSGPVDTINWIASVGRMLIGAQGAEWSVKSSAFDTPLTPTDFSIRPASTNGSGDVDALRVDQRVVFLDRTGTKLYEMVFDINSYDYGSNDITAIVPELGLPSIVRMDVQRKPDTRFHCVRSDGTVMLGVRDAVEDVMSWQDIETDGLIEDVVVLPGATGSTEDKVYYVVARTINGSTVRYLEKWAKETECRGSTTNKQADAFVTFTNNPASTTVSGLSHLIGESVVAWYDGVDAQDSDGEIETFTVSASGTITLGAAATTGMVGLSYTAQWQSAKLGLQPSIAQSILTEEKRINALGLVAAWIHAKGLKFGPDFTNLDDMPVMEDGTAVTGSSTRTTYDEERIPFPTTWDTDARLCLQAQAPRPCTVLACVVDMEISN